MSAQPSLPLTENLVAVTIAKPDTAASTLAIREALAADRALVIKNDEQYQATVREMQTVKGKWNELEEQRKQMVAPINEAHRRVQSFFAGPDGPQTYLSSRESVLKSKISDYQREQERIRQEEQRIVNEKARREREEIEARAREQERKANEKAAADRKAAEEAAAAGRAAEAAKLNARATRTEIKAAEKSATLEQQAASVVAPVIQREAPKVAGLKTREVWKFEILDASKINPLFTMPDEVKIQKQVNALKADAIPLLGGEKAIRVFSDKSLASSAG